MWSSVRVTAPRSTLLSRAPGSESQPATRVPPGLAAAGACWAGLAAAVGCAPAGGAVGWPAGFAPAVGCGAGVAAAGFDAAGVLGAGAVGAHAWMSPAEATRLRVCRKPRREIKNRSVRMVMTPPLERRVELRMLRTGQST